MEKNAHWSSIALVARFEVSVEESFNISGIVHSNGSRTISVVERPHGYLPPTRIRNRGVTRPGTGTAVLRYSIVHGVRKDMIRSLIGTRRGFGN